jgi:hypothetical protein
MACGRAALALIVAAVIGACTTSATPSPAPVQTPSAVTATTTAGTSAAAADSARTPDRSPTDRPSAGSTPVPVPPKPSGVSFAEKRKGDDPPSTEITQTVEWAAPRGEDVEIRVYGVTECIARPANPVPDTDGPCLVEHTPLPASVRTLLARAPASDGIVSWTWTGTFDCEVGLAYDPRGPAYHAVVLAAYSTSGHSIFAIAEPGRWFQPGPDEVVC